ncbi:MAG: hypothetical protein H7Y00_07015, partial [Fimbriimonadaceae bacterium]|nr:hypothetical protein [Chitinophagales bacterium]
MRYLVFTFFICVMHKTYSQSYLWADTVQYENDRGITALLSDGDRNLYAASSASSGTTSIFSTYYCGDIHLRKYDADGVIIWENIFPGKGRIFDMEFDADGNIIAGGAYTQALEIDGEEFETSLFIAGAFLIKIDTSGNIMWVKAEEPAIYSSAICSITTDADGNIYAAGLKDDITGLLRKYNSDGDIVLEEDMEQVRTTADIRLDNTGNIYVCGSAPDYATFDDIEIPDDAGGTGYVNYLAKYNSDMEAQEVYAAAYFTFDFNSSIAKNSEGIYWRCTMSPSGTFDYYNATMFYNFLSADLDTIRLINTGFDFPGNYLAAAGEDAVLLDNFDFATGVIKIN